MPQSTWANMERGRLVNDDALIRVGNALGWGPGGAFQILADALNASQKH